MKTKKAKQLPSKIKTIEFTKNLCVSLFPYIDGCNGRSASFKKIRKQLNYLLIPFENSLNTDKKTITEYFMGSFPKIKKQLEADASFIAANDPAATCVDEVIMTYPGFKAILVYRLANKLYNLGVPLIPRIMTEYAHSETGIDINPGATIGDEFFIDHGTGIVIGESTIIGNRVKIYQGVTLGALSVSKDKASTKRHPTIEDNVIIYAGSTILGGKTVIGHDSIIGGNVWLTKSVAPYSLVQHESKITICERKDFQNNKDK